MKTSNTAKQFFFTLNLTYYMQALAVLALAIVVAFLITQTELQPLDDKQTWQYIVLVIVITSLVMAYFIFRFLLGKIDRKLKLQEKMPRYARALLVRSALLEIPGLLAAIGAYITANIQLLFISIVVFVIFVILRPTKSSIAIDLNLSAKEKAALEDENAVISEVNR